jgi:tetratricopeptide (TPR) repeat protein
MKYQENLDFEISFFENLLEKRPDFTEALVALGDAYTKKGRFQDGLRIDQQLAVLRPEDSLVQYNLACDYSLLHDADRSLQALHRAISLGYDDFSFMDKDQDLEFIRGDPRYKALVSQFDKKRK